MNILQNILVGSITGILLEWFIRYVKWLIRGGSTMPLAVVVLVPEHKDLKTCEGGFVKLRRMSYGEKLQRRGFNSKMEMDMERGSRKAKSTIDIFKEEAELYDFAVCIVEHNLTKWVNSHGVPCELNDPDGREMPLDFKKPADIKLLAGQVAEEIGTYIDKLNNFEEEEETGNSKGPSEPTS